MWTEFSSQYDVIMMNAMKKFSIFLFLFHLALIVFAQRPDYLKMSGLVRQAAMENVLHQRQLRSPSSPPIRRSILTAFVRIKGDAAKILRANGCRKLSQLGDIYIVSIPLNRLTSLSLHPDVLRIEAGNRACAQMDTTATFVNALPVYVGKELPQGYTGKGVIVGVQDIGFDLTHPNFYSADMSRYRIKAMWDQLSKDTIGSELPVGRDYQGEEALLAIGHPLDGFTQTHGTHTAGIAAGSGAEGNGRVSPYRGIAYDADLVMVANAAGDNVALIDSADYYKYTYATDALGFKYIFDYADRQGKPCVINFSEGSHQDLRGDDRLYYEYLRLLTGPGHILVASAGNDADWINHIRKPVGKAKAGSFVLGNLDKAYFTVKSDKPFTFRIKVYADRQYPQIADISTETILAAPDSLFADTVIIDGKTYLWRVVGYPSDFNSSETVYDISLSCLPRLGHDVPVSLELVGNESAIDLYRIGGYLLPNPLDPSLKDGDNTYSIHSPSSAPCVISVGATAYRRGFLNYLGEWKDYNQGTGGVRTSFSGVGPTLDGRTKPDVMAPGQNIISSYSSFFINNPDNVGKPLSSDVRHFDYNGTTYAWNSNGGTSMSSPIVAGAIALWLQAYPRLTPEDCLDVFSKTCTHYDSSLVYPNNLYGYGQIDVYEGLKEVMRKAAAGIEESPRELKTSDNRIYHLDGRYAGTSVVELPRGIYIRNHKKYVKP